MQYFYCVSVYVSTSQYIMRVYIVLVIGTCLSHMYIHAGLLARSACIGPLSANLQGKYEHGIM